MSLNTHNIQEYILRRVPELTPVDEKSVFQLSPQQLIDNNIKSALLQLVPEDVYFIIEGISTAFKMWNAIAAYYQSNSEASVDALVKEFWSLDLEPGADIDECATELTKVQSKIASLDPERRPSDLSKRNCLLDHFETEAGGFHNGTVSFIKLNTHVTFLKTVNLLRDSQKNYRKYNEKADAHMAKSESGTPKKACSFCGRSNHLREMCFKWIDTAEASKWAAKNPQKAEKVMSLKKRFGKNKSGNKEQSETESLFI